MRNCPNCKEREAYRSARRWYERPLAVLGLLPYRCARCSTRYLAFGAPAVAATKGKEWDPNAQVRDSEASGSEGGEKAVRWGLARGRCR